MRRISLESNSTDRRHASLQQRSIQCCLTLPSSRSQVQGNELPEIADQLGSSMLRISFFLYDPQAATYMLQQPTTDNTTDDALPFLPTAIRTLAADAILSTRRSSRLVSQNTEVNQFHKNDRRPPINPRLPPFSHPMDRPLPPPSVPTSLGTVHTVQPAPCHTKA